MSNVGYATLSVIPSFQGLQANLDKGVAGPMAAAGKKSGAKFGDAAGREAGSSFKGRFGGALKGFSPFAGLAIGAGVTALFKGAIDEASALSESANKINVVFGDAGAQVNEFARDAADSIGQSELAARNAAASMGVFGKAAGLTGGELADFSTELTSLASDLASFYDTSVEQATQALSSGLRGEAEPLRQYGVLLDDATLRIEAMRQGLVETTKEALTPQQKILAAHAVILEQTSDAQGDFARTSDGLANSQRTLSAEWADMKAALGEELLPTVTAFVGFMKDDALPALGAVGGAAKDVGEAFAAIPGPVKAAAGAFAALRIASALGVTSAFAAGAATVKSGLDDMRLRAMLATDSFRSLRRGTVQMQNGLVTGFVPPVGRAAAALDTLKTSAQGAGAGIRRGIGGAIGILGGPWGAALIGGTALVTKFYTEHQEAKQRVDELAASLDKQTGALTTNSREWAARALADSGALEGARELGLSLEMVTDAALGDADAMWELRDAVHAARDAGEGGIATNLIGEVTRLRGTVEEGTAEWQLMKDAMGDVEGEADDVAGALKGSAGATDEATSAAGKYADKLKEARDRLRDLIDEEQERADNALGRRRDQLALVQALQEARKEMNEGKKTLDITTKAGQANSEALYDLADQWNSSSEAVRNKKGAWQNMRQEFIDLATAMGGGGDSALARAKRLAEQLLKTPKVKIDTDQIDRAKEKIRELEEMLKRVERREALGIAFDTKLRGDSYGFEGRLNGGPVSAGVPYIVGERRPEVFVPDRPGRIEPRVSGGVTVNVGTVVAHDYADFMRQTQRRARAAAGGGVRF